MKTPILSAALLVLLHFTAVTSWAHPSESDELMVQAARNFLAALTWEQRNQAVFPFSQEEWEKWHFIPMRSRISRSEGLCRKECYMVGHKILN